MIFSFKKKSYTGWHMWFAWHPIFIHGAGCWCIVWLSQVARRMNIPHIQNPSGWEYRVISRHVDD